MKSIVPSTDIVQSSRTERQETKQRQAILSRAFQRPATFVRYVRHARRHLACPMNLPASDRCHAASTAVPCSRNVCDAACRGYYYEIPTTTSNRVLSIVLSVMEFRRAPFELNLKSTTEIREDSICISKLTAFEQIKRVVD